MKSEKSSTWSAVAVIVGVISLMLGLYNLFFYASPEGYGDPINAHVGGDAYNYIINAAQATAYFVVTGASFLIAIGLNILHRLDVIIEKQSNN